MKQDIQERLREQRRFLKKSVDDFYAGDIVEAIRIAATIRVLVHETGNSKPLLKRLNKDYLQLPILDKQRNPPPPGQGAAVISIPIGFRISAEGVAPQIDLAAASYSLIPLGKWWTDVCLIVPVGGIAAYSKKEIVITLADKEGGAHVDHALPPKYAALVASQPIRFRFNDQEFDSVNLARWMTGQSGAELLDCIDRNFPFCKA